MRCHAQLYVYCCRLRDVNNNQSRRLNFFYMTWRNSTTKNMFCCFLGVGYFATSQVATSQMFNFPSGNFPYVRLGLCGATSCNGGRALRIRFARGRAPRLQQDGGRGQTWEVAVWEIAHLGSCHLRKYPWEVALGNNKVFGGFSVVRMAAKRFE